MPATAASKGAVAEWALDSLTLFLSGGELHLARPIPDDADVDRVVTRPHARAASLLQVKARTSLRDGRGLHFLFGAIPGAVTRRDLHVLGVQLLSSPPWLGPKFVFVPAARLPPPNRTGQHSLYVPTVVGSRSKWSRYVHPLGELATVLSRSLDKGPAYPFPPPGGAASLADRLSRTAGGRIFENEASAAIQYHGRGRLHVWAALVDEFGQDLSVTDEQHAAAVRVQPKGVFGIGADGRINIQVRKAAFEPRRFAYLWFTHYLPHEHRAAPWVHLVRADDFADRAESYRDRLVFQARPDAASHDEWRPYLYRVEEVAGVIETALAQRRRGSRRLCAARDEVEAARAQMGMVGLPKARAV